jgi:hypothetical protein
MATCGLIFVRPVAAGDQESRLRRSDRYSKFPQQAQAGELPYCFNCGVLPFTRFAIHSGKRSRVGGLEL